MANPAAATCRVAASATAATLDAGGAESGLCFLAIVGTAIQIHSAWNVMQWLIAPRALVQHTRAAFRADCANIRRHGFGHQVPFFLAGNFHFQTVPTPTTPT